jgi:hypothetical protein
MKRLIWFISALVLWMGVQHALADKLQRAVIVTIRHAEKPDTGDGLSPAGDARANAYVDYFKHFTVNSNSIHWDQCLPPSVAWQLQLRNEVLVIRL